MPGAMLVTAEAAVCYF